jgi:uncharacterized membrane protein (TIGR01666 family)
LDKFAKEYALTQVAMQHQAREIKYFFYSQAFADGFRTSFAILLPALIGLYLDFFQIGLTVSLGCMAVSLTDAPGPVVHKRNGMLFCSAFIFMVAILTGFARLNIYTLGLEIIATSFFFSMFNVYGTRAASVGNSGILIMILTMDSSLTPSQILPHALLILAGGIFYTVLSLLLHALRPYRISQRALGDSLREIATYLSIKTDFYDESTDLGANYKRLVDQQIIVHEKQEAVRELLFKSRQIVEETTAEGRRLVFVFAEAVDLFEDITATYYDYALLRKQFADSGALKLINKTLKKATAELDAIGFAIQSNANFHPSLDYTEELNDLKKKIDDVIPKGETNVLVLRKILVNIRKLFTDLNNISQYFQRDITVQRTRVDSARFVSHQPLDPKIIWDNFSLQSSTFRHALRVCIACIAGFIVAKFIDYGHHSYWVLLTIAFILKPAFSLTKQRNIQRIIGTFIGGAIGVIILTLTHDKTIHFVFLVLFMLGTYSFMRIKYLVMVICTTPYILILFSFLGGEYRSVIEERLLDTALGCVIAFSASYFLFPSWEAGQLKKDMQGIVRANANYLQKIVDALSGYGINLLEYKLARKDVYLNSANLSATFQRMLSEPKSKQGAEKDIHQFVVLNHILFSNTANLSASVFAKEKIAYRPELIIPGKKALNKLNEVRKRLGDQTAITPEPSKKNLASEEIGTADDRLIKEQLDFIYNLANDLEKTTNAIIG